MKVVGRGRHFNLLFDMNKQHYLFMPVPFPYSKGRYKSIDEALKYMNTIERRIDESNT
jgi:hypothetical protein